MNRIIPRLIASALLVTAGASAFGQTVEQVVKAWADKRAGIRNVQFELNVECFKAKETNKRTGEVIRANDVTYQQRVTLVLDFEKGRFRRDQKGEEFDILTKKNEPYDGSTAYDGATYRSVARPNGGGTAAVRERGRTSDYVEITGDLSQKTFHNYLMPALYTCGVVPLEPNGKLFPSQFHKYDSSQFADIMFPSRNRQGTGSEGWFEVPESGPRYRTEYLVGKGVGAPVLARVTLREGKPMYETTIKYAKMDGRQVPQSWDYKNTWEGGLLRYRCAVERVEFNQELPDSLFIISPDDGMVAAKLRYAEPGQSVTNIPSRETYEVKDGGKLIRNDSLNPFADQQPKRTNRSWYWIAGSIGVFLILGIVAIARARRRQMKRTTEFG